MVSNKNKGSSRRRPYRLKARARRQEEVHRRITEAAVHLHGSVGPARTTVSDVAKHAGVRRATVYNHFPNDLELMDACSTHWFTENPPPQPAPWAEILDPRRRVETALQAMYTYYDHQQKMLEHILRDAALVPALDEILQRKWWPMLQGIVDILATGWGVEKPSTSGGETEVRLNREGDDKEIRASLKVVLSFFTWKTLVASGLSNEQAAKLAAAWVCHARIKS